MSNIIFKVEEIEDIKKRLESIIQRGQKIDPSHFKKLVKQNRTEIPKFLDEHETKVFEYIRNNPGTSNQDVVNALKGTRSRGPVYNIIAKLEDYGLVIERPDNANVQRHQLFENKESLIIRVENDIKNFRKSYLKLIKGANLEYQKLDLRGHVLGSGQTHISDEVYSMIIDRYYDLTRIFEELVKGYSMKAIFEWPEKVKDSESLNRLYLMVFHMLGEIFSEHVKYSIPFDIQDEHKRIGLLRDMQDSLKNSLEEPKTYLELIRNFNKYNWSTEFDAVMSDLFTALNTGIEWKDYRAAIR
jgi:hypothetical protein